MSTSFFQDLLNTVADRGRSLLDYSLGGQGANEDITSLARALHSSRGEASGVAIARELLSRYRQMSFEERRSFFEFLAREFQPDPRAVEEAAARHIRAPSEASLRALQKAVTSPRQEFFRRVNLAPGATSEIVHMRVDLLRALKSDPDLQKVDDDLLHLLGSWFNRGFLVVRRIDWSTPANILEKIIAYEAVHEIQGWDDLRRRLDPADRRCFAFFHPSLIDEPLIFVEVALMRETPGSIQDLLYQEHASEASKTPPTVAVFYSISNCQEGLRGISFGNFLIKQVVEELARELPSLKTFVTLSPVPSFARWLDRVSADPAAGIVSGKERDALRLLADPGWIEDHDDEEELKSVLMPLAASYFLQAKAPNGQPVDPVARFHLGNGARLERINWLGDVSEKGLRQSHGLMVNYLYDLKEIEKNHEAFVNSGAVASARAARSLLKGRRDPDKAAAKVGAASQAVAKADDATRRAEPLQIAPPAQKPATQPLTTKPGKAD